MPEIPTVGTKNGFKMPIVGFGTWQVNEGELELALDAALEAGYRFIDTAYSFLNETVIGNVLQKWFSAGKLKREELFIVTKLPVMGNHPDHVENCLKVSLKRLQLSYLDMYLIHAPWSYHYESDDVLFPQKPNGEPNLDFATDIVAVWKKMEEQVNAGRTRFIGMGNYSAEQVGRILAVAEIPPAVNQIQLHAYLQQPDLVKYLQDNDIVVLAYSSLGSPGTTLIYSVEYHLPNILKDDVVVKIAEEVGKSPAQVALRHMVQKNIAITPKSVTPARIQQNLELFDFELSPAQMEKIDGLDQNNWILNFKEVFKGVEKHPEFQLN